MEHTASLEYLWLMAGFGLLMIVLVWFKTHDEQHVDGFLVADRQVGVWGGMLTIAISWCWADLYFVAAQQAYLDGWGGMLWFALPATLCFVLFGVLGQRVRQLMPNGYSLPDFIAQRFQNNNFVHIAYTTIGILFQICVLGLNATIAGLLFATVAGIDATVSMIVMTLLALAYSLLSGLKASIFTDWIQTAIMVLGALVLLPWAIIEIGGFGALSDSFAGLENNRTGFMDWDIIWNFGILMAITQFTLPVVDQMFFQRAMAIKDPKKIKRVFSGAGIYAGLAVLVFGLFGIIGAHLVQTGVMLPVEDPQMSLVAAIDVLLPDAALYLLALMFFACVFSTSDSAFCAIASLCSVDIYKRYVGQAALDKKLLKVARLSMLAAAVLAIGLALLKFKILWMIFILGNIATASFVPTLFAIYSKRISGNVVATAIMLSLVVCAPVFIYGNLVDNINLLIISSLGSLTIGLVVCMLGVVLKPNRGFDFILQQ